MPNHLWASYPTGELDWFNEQTYVYSGAKHGDLDGTAWGAIVHPDELAAGAAAWAHSIATGEVHETEFRIRRADGEYRWFLVRAEPVRSPDGHSRSKACRGGRRVSWTTMIEDDVIYAFGRDVTVEQEKAEALAKSEEALRQSQKMETVGQLIGGVAHDFNNLLTAVTGGLELLQHRLAAGRYDELDRCVEMARTGAERGSAHPAPTRLPATPDAPTPTDVDALIAGMRDIVDRSIGPSIEVKVVGSPDLWPVLVDTPQLENALLNLCINARDAMPDAGTITIETLNKTLDAQAAATLDLPEGEFVLPCVSDTGTEITPDVMSDAGYRVLNAADGPAGVKLLQSREGIDILITDVVFLAG